MSNAWYESPNFLGGETLTVGAVKKAIEESGMSDAALFYTSTDKEVDQPWPTRIILVEVAQ